MRLVVFFAALLTVASAFAESPQELNKALFDAAKRGDAGKAEQLLNYGADPNGAVPNESQNPFQKAVRENHLDVVKLLVNHGADLRPKGVSVLDDAADRKHEQVARYLLSKGLTPNDSGRGRTLLLDRFGFTPTSVDEIEFLLELGANPNVQSDQGMTPLMIIVGSPVIHDKEEQRRVEKVIHLLIKKGADLNAQGMLGGTPLIHAVTGGNIFAIRALVEAGADVNLKNKGGQSPLWLALKEYQRDGRIEYLIEHGADVRATDINGVTTLMASIESGRSDHAAFLIKHGVNPNAGTKTGRTAAHSAAGYIDATGSEKDPGGTKGRRYVQDLLRLLSDSGADLNIADDEGTTPLHVAAKSGYLEAVRFLLDHGCDPNRQNAKGETALFLSVMGRVDDFSKSKLLLDRGADINAKGPDQRTPLMVAARMMKRGHVVLLLGRNANADATDSKGGTALNLLAAICAERSFEPQDYAGLVRELADHMSSVNQADSKGMTALMWTAIANNADAVNALLGKGAEIDTRSADGRTALMWAASTNATNTIPILLSHGANLSTKDKAGRTALDWAKALDQSVASLLVPGTQNP